jgi:hypothetical protein
MIKVLLGGKVGLGLLLCIVAQRVLSVAVGLFGSGQGARRITT